MNNNNNNNVNYVKTLSEQLEALEDPVRERDLVIVLLSSLPEEYKGPPKIYRVPRPGFGEFYGRKKLLAPLFHRPKKVLAPTFSTSKKVVAPIFET